MVREPLKSLDLCDILTLTAKLTTARSVSVSVVVCCCCLLLLLLLLLLHKFKKDCTAVQESMN